jgi:adenylosuccinate synthase
VGPVARSGLKLAGATVVTGTQWGDEGKGKVVDYLAERADVVVRFNGGANAGHTVIAGGKKFAFHLVPSGIARPGKMNVIAAGVAVDPEVLAEEIAEAQRAVGRVHLLISERAHVVLPFHKLLDELREDKRAQGAKLGTTKRGIGPVYEAKAARSGMRVAELVDRASLVAHVEASAREVAPLVPPSRLDEFSPASVIGRLSKAADALRPFVGDAEEALWRAQDEGKQILLEGAQAVMLDLDFGTYPFVTSSSCTAGAAAALSGLPPSAITRSVGVVKAYTTRVGAGPFPTELPEEGGGKRLRDAGAEFGTTTGRPRRCGWLDLVILRRAVRLCGLTDLALTKLDVLSGIEPLEVCVAYTLDGTRLDTVPARASAYARCKPVLERMEPIPRADWHGLASTDGTLRALPTEAKDYVKFVESRAHCKVTWVGVGPAREDILTAN